MHAARARRVGATIVAATMLGTALPAGAATTPVKKWAQRTCSAIASWTDDVRTGTESAIGESTELGDAAGRDALVDVYAASAKATKRLVKALDKGGTPDVENGARVAKAFKKAFSSVRDAYTRGKKDVGAIVATGEPAAFFVEVDAVHTVVDKGIIRALRMIDKAATRYDSPKLTRAFASASACEATTLPE